MQFYDMLIMLDGKNRITGFEVLNETVSEIYRVLLGSNEGQTLWHLFPELEKKFRGKDGDRSEEGELVWENERFCWRRIPVTKSCSIFLMKLAGDREFLMKSTLDQITQGIQIYDKNGMAVYFNPATRKISGIPDDMSVEGRHLLDLYDEDEEISTILTAIRTGSPVLNRVDHFKLSTGKELATVNTAYPLYRRKELVGAVSVDMDQQYVKRELKRLQEAEDALASFREGAEEIRFSGYTFDHIIGRGMAEVVLLARKAAESVSNVLLVGETGTGKEIFAQSIHRASSRKKNRLVALNCAAVPETLIESVLFGTVKGSFTGSENRTGYLEQADGGTLFLDELNSMSLSMQSKLLRVLQEGVFRRVGGEKDIRTNVRIIASCNEDPFTAIRENRIRRDLFYRISTIMIELPPLRNHLEDLEELMRYHIRANDRFFLHTFTEFQDEVMRIFRSYSWPGNVRELFHVLDYARNVADDDVLRPEHLPPYMKRTMDREEENTAPKAVPETSETSFDFTRDTLQDIMDIYEHKVLLAALEHYGYNITRTADALGLRRQSLQYRIRKYGIQI